MVIDRNSDTKTAFLRNRGGSLEDRSQQKTDGLDRATLAGVRDGDPRALSVFFDYCFDRVYSLARRLTGDRTTAEDVTQDVFVKILQAARRLDPDRDPLPWVTVITYNVCRDRWRSRDHKVAQESVSIDDEQTGGRMVATPESDPETAVLNAEKTRVVEAALSRLPEESRTVVLLRDYCGMRHARIAEMTGDSEAAVRKRYSRALAQLAEELKGFWNE
jgi:RNA polymerase sigma factor (sigma-70 family)